MKNLKLLAVVAVVVVMVVAACGGGGAASGEPTESAPATSQTTSGTQPTATTAVEVTEKTPVPTMAVEPTAASEGELNLSSITGGLTQLQSYKSTMDLHFTGTDAQGQAVETSYLMAEEFIQEPRAQSIAWTNSESKGGQAPTTTSGKMITIGQTMYIINTDDSGTETCMAVTSSEATPPTQALSPDMWGSISGANYVNTETVNGVSAKHYVWKDSMFAGLGYTGGKGETWVADGGYVVKQRIETTGKGTFMAGTDEEGTSTYEWNVTDANGSFQIVAPEGCEGPATDIPMMADATDQASYGGTITYFSPSAFADVVSFYKSEMPNAGWQASGTPTEMEGVAILEFTKDERTASVMITWDDSTNKTGVVITVAKP